MHGANSIKGGVGDLAHGATITSRRAPELKAARWWNGDTVGYPMSRRCSPTGDRRDFADAWIEAEFEQEDEDEDEDEDEAGAGAIKERRFFTAVSGRLKSVPPGSPPTTPHRQPRASPGLFPLHRRFQALASCLGAHKVVQSFSSAWPC